MKKILITLIIITGLAIIIVLAYLFYTGKNIEINKEEELSPEFFEWISQYKRGWEIEDPYVNCIFNNTCNGTFYLEINLKFEFNRTEAINILKKYGEIRESTMSLEIKDPYKVEEVLNLPFINEVKLEMLTSDYSLPYREEELKYCNKDEDCIKAGGCCGCNDKVINKKYLNEWSSLKEFSCKSIVCIAVFDDRNICFADSKCISNSCKLILDQKWICKRTDFIDLCKKIPVNKWNVSKIYIGGKTYLCDELYDFCNIEYEENKSKETFLSIDIKKPLDNSIIKDNKTDLEVLTSKKAICIYSTNVSFPNSKEETFPKQMSITNNTHHSQLIENLQDNGYYRVKLNCADESGNSQISFINFKTNILFSDMKNLTKKWFIGNEVGSSLLTRDNLPNLLKDGGFYSGENVYVQFTSTLRVHAKIENSTSNGDLNSPRVLLEIGTNSSNPLFHYELTFSKSVNFSNMPNGEYINLFKKYYKTQTDSTNSKIILREWDTNKEIILEDNEPIKVNGEIVAGTYVDIDNRGGDVTKIFIDMAMPNPNKDYVAVGEYYDDYVFNSLRLDFKSYSNETGAEIYLESARD